MKIGEPIPSNVTYYNSYEALRDVSTRPIFLKHVITNNIVTESYVGFVYNDTVNYMRGGDTSVTFENKKNQLSNIYNNSGCQESTSNGVNGFRCIKDMG